MATFSLSLQKGCFPEEIEIARVCLIIAPIYKADDVNEEETTDQFQYHLVFQKY